MMEVIDLIQPIHTHKGSVSQLTFKRPKARSFLDNGTPFEEILHFDDRGTVRSLQVKNDPMAMRGFIADMTGIDPSDVDDLDALDFQKAMSKVREIIRNPPKPETSSTP